MIGSLLLHAILILNSSKPSYPLLVTGEPSAVQGIVKILNSEMYPDSPVEAQLIDVQAKEYGIHLIQKLNDPGYTNRKNRFQCALNYLLGDSSKTFKIRLEENSRVLISDGRKAIIDIADVAKFDVEAEKSLRSFNILLHELYEQYQLQVVDGHTPGKITTPQLNLAHIKATRKESNFYSLTAIRTQAHINDYYIHIEFTSVIDSSKTHYFAYYSNGNIDRVEKRMGNDGL